MQKVNVGLSQCLAICKSRLHLHFATTHYQAFLVKQRAEAVVNFDLSR